MALEQDSGLRLTEDVDGPRSSSIGNQEDLLSSSNLIDMVRDVVLSLTPREKRVLDLRQGLIDGRCRTQAEVGREIGRSRWTVSRIEKRAFRKLLAPSSSQKLRV